MKVAVVHHSGPAEVMQLRGRPVCEHYKPELITWIERGLREAGHVPLAIEGDTHLFERIYGFLSPDRNDCWPGLALNIAYGPDLPPLPVVLKPRVEANSVGVDFVDTEEELRAGVKDHLREFHQPVLIETFVEGRDIAVALVGNPPEPLPPAEIVLGNGGPPIYTRGDKGRSSGRKIETRCPAPLTERQLRKVTELTRAAFAVLRCEDWGRADFRLTPEGEFYFLEMNSLPHLSPNNSLFASARAAGLELPQLLDRLVRGAAARQEIPAGV